MATSIRAMLAHRRLEAVNRPVLSTDDEGSLNTSGALTIVGVIIGAVVGLAILAALVPTFFGSLADIGTVFTDANTTTGNEDADALLPVFGLLIAFGGLFAIVGLALLVVAIKKKGA
jgi:hypothetical protein